MTATRIPIAIVIVILVLDLVMPLKLLDLPWPIEDWQMYRLKARTAPQVTFRRLLLVRDDGTTEWSRLTEPASFLAHPYRIDSALRKSRARFLVDLLALVRARTAGGDRIVGVIHETRTWRYREMSLAASLALPADDTYRVMLIPPVVGPGRRDGREELFRDRFRTRRFYRHTGVPRDWWATASVGVGFDPTSGDTAIAIVPNPRRDGQWIERHVDIPAGLAGRELMFDATALAHGAGGAIELVIEPERGAPSRVRSEPCPADRQWHKLRALGRLPEAGKATVTIRLIGDHLTAPVVFDDPRVSVGP